MGQMSPWTRLGLVTLLAAGTACSVDPLRAEGRPCGPASPCGAGYRCDPGTWRCVADLLDLSASEVGLPDRSAIDRELRDQPREGRGDLGVDLDLRADLDLHPGDLRADLDLSPDLPHDSDGDGVLDSSDNCPKVKNPDQSDHDGDKLGDLCDPDRDGDSLANEIDPAPEVKNTVYFAAAPQDPQTLSCTKTNLWTVVGNQLCETGALDGLTCQQTAAAIPSQDYLVASRMTVTPGDATQNAGNGIAFRIGGGSSYLCYLAVNQKRLVLGKLSSGGWTVLQQTAAGSAPGSGPFELRASAKGSKLTCAEANAGLSLNGTDSAFSSGGVGIHAFHANGCVDSFVVVAP